MAHLRRKSVSSPPGKIKTSIAKVISRTKHNSFYHKLSLRGDNPLYLLGTPKVIWAGSPSAWRMVRSGILDVVAQKDPLKAVFILAKKRRALLLNKLYYQVKRVALLRLYCGRFNLNDEELFELAQREKIYYHAKERIVILRYSIKEKIYDR